MKLSRYEQETIVNYNAGEPALTIKSYIYSPVALVTETLSESFFPFQSLLSATASRGRSAPSRGNGQGR